VRDLDSLVDRADPAMDLVKRWLGESERPAELLDCAEGDGRRTLLTLQVTTHSPMGALAFESGGLLVDHGWVRVLGAGCDRLPRDLASWNGLGADPRLEGALLVGDDVIGGFFAVNGGRFATGRGNVFYLAPDSLRWQDLGAGYTQWLSWLLLGDVETFYEGMRWPGWPDEVAALDGDRAYSIYPFPFAKGPPIPERRRRAVPIEELWNLYAIDLPGQLRGG